MQASLTGPHVFAWSLDARPDTIPSPLEWPVPEGASTPDRTVAYSVELTSDSPGLMKRGDKVIIDGITATVVDVQPCADEEINLDEDWDFHLRGGPDHTRGAVLIPGGDCCCGGTHTRDYTPAKARRIAARLTELADEAEKVEPAPILTPEELDAR